MSITTEFKEFVSRGNVVELAIGVVIGGAFGSVSAALVTNVVMPPIGWLLSGINFTDIATTIKAAGPDGKGAVVIGWGTFIQSVINFLIVATVMFGVVKAMNAVRRKNEAAPPTAPPEPSEELRVLQEIRDALRAK
jgi:large conductance mechanosensitive channel